MTHTKANYSARMAPMGLAIERADGNLRFVRTSSLQTADLAAKLSMTERIVAGLKDGKKTPERLRDLLGIEAKGKAKADFDKGISNLKRAGRIQELDGGASLGLAAIVDQAEIPEMR